MQQAIGVAESELRAEVVVKLRRVDAGAKLIRKGQLSINFHCDHAECTMQVPLNGDEEYDGGRLVLVREASMPPAALATAHPENHLNHLNHSNHRNNLNCVAFPKIQSLDEAALPVLESPPRPAGSFTIHNRYIVHGVTKLNQGIRYGLFLLYKP